MRWNSDSSYDNYMVDLEHKEIMHRIGQMQLILADRHNWLKVEDTHLDDAMVETILVEMPDILTKVINHNLHLSRTLDQEKEEHEEKAEELHRWLNDANAKIADLNKEIKGYKAALKLTEDANEQV